MLFPASKVQEFYTEYQHSALRTGQQFHSFMQLHKCVNEKALCDMIYKLDGQEFKDFLVRHIDWNA